MPRHFYLHILLLAVTLLTACAVRHTDETELIILYSTDIHGTVFPYDFASSTPTSVSMSNISTYVNRQREDHPDGVILLDGGDMTQGNPAMYYYNYVAMRTPHLIARAANELGFDAVALGNHDLEAGPNVYADRLPRQLKMPILAANAIDIRTGEPMFRPYLILERQGYRIAVVAFITPGVPQWLPKSIWPNLTFEDMRSSAARWLPVIQEKEHPDLIVGVFHAGSEEYLHDEYNRPKEEPDGAFHTIQHVRGFDLALLGHDHLSLAEKVVNDYGDTVHVLEPAAFSTELGQAEIHLRRDAHGDVQKEILLSRVNMSEVEPNHAFDDLFQTDFDSINSYLNHPIGEITCAMDGISSLTGPSPIVDFIHTVQLDITEADVSFASALSTFRDINAGGIKMRDIFAMYKYENQVHKIWMTGDEIHRFLEWGYGRQYNQMTDSTDYVLGFKFTKGGNLSYGTFGPELETPQYNFTSAAGINYTVDISQPKGQRVTIHGMSNGETFKPDHKYTVAINSYQASGGGGFLTQGLGWTLEDRLFHTINESSKDMCYYIARYLRHHGSITPKPLGNWHVEPADWWSRQQHRDISLMLPYISDHKYSTHNR